MVDRAEFGGSVRIAMLHGLLGFLRRLHPDHARIARAGLWLLLFTIIAKLAGAGKEIAIAWRFGRGPEVDAYNLALTLSTWLPATVSAVAAIVLVPVMVRVRSDSCRSEARFLKELNGAALTTGVAFAALTWLAASPFINFFASGLPDATQQLAVDMLQRLAPLALFTVLAGFLVARLQAKQDHRYALLEGLPALAIVALLLAWQAADTLALIAGTLFGAVFQVWLLYRCAATPGVSQGIAFSFASAQWRALVRAAVFMGAGQFVLSFVTPVDQWYASDLGSGKIATLGYANRIIALGMALGASIIARATLPIFSEAIAGGEGEKVRRNALRWSGAMLLAGMLGAALVWALAMPLTAALFERGAFSPEDTKAVGMALRWGIWQMPPYLSSLVLVSLLAAQGRYRLIATVAALNLLCKVIGNELLADTMGLAGILLSTVTMYMISMVLCWAAIMRYLGTHPLRDR